jgi:hypothetical protein
MNHVGRGTQAGYEWVYEEIYGAAFSTLTKVIEEGTFKPSFHTISDYPK